MESPLPSRGWLHSRRFWLGLAAAAQAAAVSTLGSLDKALAFLLISGLWPLMIQWGLWKHLRPLLRRRGAVLLLALLVPLGSAFWVVFQFSAFYGLPRQFMKQAFQEPAPLVFRVEALSETADGRTLRVRLNPRYLQAVLERHFRKRETALPDGRRVYDRATADAANAGFCRVTVTPDFQSAEIEYAAR